MGENGGRTTGQLQSHDPCACLAWCLMSLAHIQCVGTAGLAVSDDGNGRCRKTLEFQGCYTKGYARSAIYSTRLHRTIGSRALYCSVLYFTPTARVRGAYVNSLQ